MTNEQDSTEKKSDFQKYQYAYLAGVLTQKGEEEYVPGSLELLAGKDGLNLSDDAMGFVRGANASKEGIDTVKGIYSEKYFKALENTTVDQYIKWYGDVLKDIPEEERSKILKVLKEKGSEKIGKIQKEFINAQKIIEDKTDLFTEKHKEDAKNFLQKYQAFLGAYSTLEKYKTEELRSNAVNVSKKNDLSELVSKL